MRDGGGGMKVVCEWGGRGGDLDLDSGADRKAHRPPEEGHAGVPDDSAHRPAGGGGRWCVNGEGVGRRWCVNGTAEQWCRGREGSGGGV